MFQKRSLLIGKCLKRHSGVGAGVDTILILEVDDIVGDIVADATGISRERRMVKIDVRDILLHRKGNQIKLLLAQHKITIILIEETFEISCLFCLLVYLIS